MYAIRSYYDVGKSSLLNKLVGEKIAAVSNKPQTTRTKITGVLTKEETQFVFIDTPGMHTAKNKLSEHMVKAVNSSVSDVDIILLVVDCTKNINETEKKLIENFKVAKSPVILVINKIDLLSEKSQLLSIIDNYSKLCEFKSIIPVSVIFDDGIVITSYSIHYTKLYELYPITIITDLGPYAIV